MGDHRPLEHLPPYQPGMGAIEVRYENRVPLCWERGRPSSILYWGTDTVYAVRGGTRVEDGVLCLVQLSDNATSPMWIKFDSRKMRWIPEQIKLLVDE